MVLNSYIFVRNCYTIRFFLEIIEYLYYNVIQIEQYFIGGSMSISLRLNDVDTDIIKSYASMRGMTVSELVRRIVMDHIEEEFDLKEYEKAYAEYKKNPVTYTLDEVIEELDLA